MLTRAFESLKKMSFNCLLLTKVYIVWTTKVRGVIFHDTEELRAFWRKTDLWFEKRQFRKFSPEHLKASKLGLWWDPFVQSKKGMTLKFTKELCVMTMKNNTKFEEELTCHFKTDRKNLTNFDSSTWKYLKNCSLISSSDQRIYIMFELRKVERSYV